MSAPTGAVLGPVARSGSARELGTLPSTLVGDGLTVEYSRGVSVLSDVSVVATPGRDASGLGAMLIGRRTFDVAQTWGGNHAWGPAFVRTHHSPAGWPRPDSTRLSTS